MITIAFPLFEKALVTGISGPCEMLNAAENLFKTRHKRRNQYHLRLVRIAEDHQPVELTGGIRILPDALYSDITAPDWIVIPPIWGNPLPALRQNQALRQWLVNSYRSGSTIVATGTSVCFLAEESLLDGIPVTTHWYYFEKFRQRYPDLELNTRQFITYGENIYCAGSINALSDLIVYLIGQRYGESISRVVEQHFSHEINRSYEKPFFLHGGDHHHDEDIIRAQEWCHQHWQENVTLELWAKGTDLPVRTLTRRFKSATGMTPLHYLRTLRINRSMELLKETNLPMADVAELVGYKDTNYFSKVFKTHNDLSPGEYRKMVRAKLFYVDDR